MFVACLSYAPATADTLENEYAQKVLEHIAQQPKPRAKGIGTVTLSFILASDGRLKALKIARSSGSGALDRAGLSLIRNAVPFPRPPEGVRSVYSIDIASGISTSRQITISTQVGAKEKGSR